VLFQGSHQGLLLNNQLHYSLSQCQGTGNILIMGIVMSNHQIKSNHIQIHPRAFLPRAVGALPFTIKMSFRRPRLLVNPFNPLPPKPSKPLQPSQQRERVHRRVPRVPTTTLGRPWSKSSKSVPCPTNLLQREAWPHKDHIRVSSTSYGCCMVVAHQRPDDNGGIDWTDWMDGIKKDGDRADG